MEFVVTAFLVAAFLLVMGALLLFWSSRLPRPEQGRATSLRNILAFLGILYVALANIAAFTASGTGIFPAYLAPCENVVNQSTAVSDTVTTYTYTTSCAGQAIPRSAENLHVIFSYLLYLILIFAGVGMLTGIVWVVRKW